jgi:phage shock protein E
MTHAPGASIASLSSSPDGERAVFPSTMKLSVFLAVVALGTPIVACGAGPAPATPVSAAPINLEGVEEVDGARAHELVKGDARLVDVRTPDEFKERHIDGAENVPLDRLYDQDVGAKDGAVIVYCKTGGRAKRAASALRSKGYTKVYLLGAMDNWEKAAAVKTATETPAEKK